MLSYTLLIQHAAQVLTLAGGIATLAAGVEEGQGHFGLVIVGYVIMRIGLVLQWLRAARSSPGSESNH